MAIFIAVVRKDGEAAYTASFPDFPGLAAHGTGLDALLARAREVLALHVERMLEANTAINVPTPADEIERDGALLLAAVEIPDDVRTAHVDLEIPALSLARIDSMARRHGLTRSALFVQAVDHWAMQEGIPRDRRGGVFDGPTLSDFVNPLELKVEAPASDVYPPPRAETDQRAGEGTVAEVSIGDIAAELERLIEGASASKQDGTVVRRSAKAKGE
jgi:predicted RNase H-like HicB family nuclease